uniref:GTP-binding protein n=1 Tax=Bacteroides intestinalis TaxID=329854 RepID=UPI0022E6D07C
MLDGAVLILSAKEGIQAQTKLLFSTLQKLQIPTIIFINKIDRAGVNLERLYMDIKTNLSQDVLFMQTVVDGSVYPVCSQTYIKEEYKEFEYLADSEISPADYWNTIIALVAKAKVYPVLHGSAMFNIGINELLDAISSFILPPASVSNRLSAYLYKIEHDPKGHKRSFLKIIDGSLRLRDVVRINDSEKFIKIKNLKT